MAPQLATAVSTDSELSDLPVIQLPFMAYRRFFSTSMGHGRTITRLGALFERTVPKGFLALSGDVGWKPKEKMWALDHAIIPEADYHPGETMTKPPRLIVEIMSGSNYYAPGLAFLLTTLN